MASNFHISFYKSRGNLFIKLKGDFDGSSAHELLNALKEHSQRSYSIHIDTDNLETIFPFGRDVFEKNFKSLRRHSKNIIFAGENKNYIAPTWHKVESL